MKSHGKARTRALITGAVGFALAAFICVALLLGLRANEPTPRVAALQDARVIGAEPRAPQQQMRLLLLSAILATVALAALAAHAQFARARHERAAREARAEARRLLQSVDEGVFLLDASFRIGALWSAALTRMFNREDFAGVALQELLQELLPPAAVTTAIEDIKLLWNAPPRDPLSSSDPHGDLEIQVDDAHGGRDARHLQFNFHRFVNDDGVQHVLVRVSDVTSQVLLARELLETQNSADSQVGMLLGVMQIDPLQLATFIDATEAGLQLVNAVLKEPARTDGEFRMKLDRLACELHAIKGDASTLGITGVAQRTHRFEDLLVELKARSELSGINFLPLVLRLDELLAHLRSIRELAVRVAALRDGAIAAAPGAHALHPAHERAASPADDLATTLQGLAARLGRDQQKKFRLSLDGLAQIPPSYRTTVRDLLIQLLRNSAVHGIESAQVRRERTKSEEGLVHAEFRATGDGYELVFEDDGAGLALEKLKTAAIRKHLTTAAEAARMDTRAAMGLIFRGGVSTCDRVTMDAGRGVGMELVARRIAALGGKIVLSTDPGKFTRVKIALPALQVAKSAVA